jgi:hypothetical protein
VLFQQVQYSEFPVPQKQEKAKQKIHNTHRVEDDFEGLDGSRAKN